MIQHPFTIKFDDLEFEPTPEYLDAIKSLLIAEIKMMRIADADNAQYWYCGSATIENMAASNYLVLTFGGEEDVDYLNEMVHVFVTVPFN